MEGFSWEASAAAWLRTARNSVEELTSMMRWRTASDSKEVAKRERSSICVSG